jgi:putative endonuclease
MIFWVYILQSEASGQYYVGHTSNLADRLRRHNASRTVANRGRGPWRLIHSEEFATRGAAAARERAIKAQKSRQYIATLCATKSGG